MINLVRFFLTCLQELCIFRKYFVLSFEVGKLCLESLNFKAKIDFGNHLTPSFYSRGQQF